MFKFNFNCAIENRTYKIVRWRTYFLSFDKMAKRIYFFF